MLDHVATAFRLEPNGQLARTRNDEISGTVLIAERMTAYDDWFGPARHKARNIATQDGLTEHRTAENVTNCAIRRAPHLLEAEFLDPRFVGRDGGAFDTDAMFFDRLSRVDRDLIIRLVAIFHAKIVIGQIDVEIGEDQTVLDPLPYNACHLVAIEFHNGVRDLDLVHEWLSGRVGCVERKT